MDLGIRLLSLSIQNIKNMKNGEIEFKSRKKVEKNNFEFEESDVIGIYGPNGSSKTSLIDSFEILKRVIINKIGEDHDSKIFNLIAVDEQVATITLEFLFNVGALVPRIYRYCIKLGKDIEKKRAILLFESLIYKEYIAEEKRWTKESKFIEIDFRKDIDSYFSPASFLVDLKKIDKNIPSLLLMLRGQASSINTSFIFSENFKDIIEKTKAYNEFYTMLHYTKGYAIHNLHVYDNREISKIAATDAIPFFYKSETENISKITKGSFNIFGESITPIEIKPIIYKYFEEINIVINKIIPNFQIEIIDLGSVLLDNAQTGFKCEVISIRNNIRIPLKLESDGIKKIISLISAMVDAFNNPSAILVVDELDSGIYEYLLGELLLVFKERAKGQLLFTSHNLRALEVIRDSILFTSLDSQDRYIRHRRLSETGNLRDQYLKKLFLDDINEYAEHIDTYDIYRAFKKAGELINHGE